MVESIETCTGTNIFAYSPFRPPVYTMFLLSLGLTLIPWICCTGTLPCCCVYVPGLVFALIREGFKLLGLKGTGFWNFSWVQGKKCARTPVVNNMISIYSLNDKGESHLSQACYFGFIILYIIHRNRAKQNWTDNIGVQAIGTMQWGQKPSLTRKGTCLPGTRKSKRSGRNKYFFSDW